MYTHTCALMQLQTYTYRVLTHAYSTHQWKRSQTKHPHPTQKHNKLVSYLSLSPLNFSANTIKQIRYTHSTSTTCTQLIYSVQSNFLKQQASVSRAPSANRSHPISRFCATLSATVCMFCATLSAIGCTK